MPHKQNQNLKISTKHPSTRWYQRLLIGLVVLIVAYISACVTLSLLNPSVKFTTSNFEQLPAVFPSNFLLGTATSAHQVEGGNNLNDWSQFEQTPGNIKNGDKSGRADDSWNLVPQDIALMKSLGVNSYRFSIEWSRLEPQEGQYNEAAFAHYNDELVQLKAAGITPMVTLLHFTLPIWLASKGGLLSPGFPSSFGQFATVAAKRYGPLVDLWCTINEPNVQMFNGYVDGIWPPGEHSKPDAVKAYANLLRAHAAAAAAVHQNDPGAKVGVAMHLIDFEPHSKLNLGDWYATLSTADAFNWAFYDSVTSGRIHFSAIGYPGIDQPLATLAGSVDFFGMNYYRRDLISLSPTSPNLITDAAGPGPKNDLGWEIHPEGMLQLMRQSYNRYHLPIFITENGLADASGQKRGPFLQAHLYAVALALQAKIPVMGYYHWSLIDNFEWAEGFTPRFGLYQVDYTDETRHERGGVKQFQTAAKQITGR